MSIQKSVFVVFNVPVITRKFYFSRGNWMSTKVRLQNHIWFKNKIYVYVEIITSKKLNSIYYFNKELNSVYLLFICKYDYWSRTVQKGKGKRTVASSRDFVWHDKVSVVVVDLVGSRKEEMKKEEVLLTCKSNEWKKWKWQK